CYRDWSSDVCSSDLPQPYQLDRWKLDVTIQRWYACFNTSVSPPTFVKYSTDPGSGCTVDTTKEYLVRAHSTLTWQYSGVTRTLRSEERRVGKECRRR